MRVLVQRVTSAHVVVGAGEVVGAIEPATQGLLALVGVTHDDDSAVARRLAEKLWYFGYSMTNAAPPISAHRSWWSASSPCKQTVKGRRPSWNAAAPRPSPSRWWSRSPTRCAAWAPRYAGVFGADMAVSLVNDGPVTVLLES